MTAGSARPLRTVAFGTLDGGPWGLAWSLASPILLLSGGADTMATPVSGAEMTGSGDAEDWYLTGNRLELEVSGQGDPAWDSPSDRPPGFGQLCHVRGAATFAGAELAVDAPGVRGYQPAVDLRASDSLRLVSARFGPADGIALIAVRPRKARGHDREAIAAAVFEPTGSHVVADPRLSTTYDANGTPARAGLELWLGEQDATQSSRRAAGRAVRTAARVRDQDLDLQAQLFRWHSRGLEGAGIYLLARPA